MTNTPTLNEFSSTARSLDGVHSSLLQLNPAPDAASEADRCPIAAEGEIVDEENG